MRRVIVVGSAIADVLVRSDNFKVLKSHQVTGGVAMCEVYGGKMEVDQVVMGTGGAGS
ncbi:hypothetical protein HY333_01125, partial [Candidatus Collierbacteria bacterium]|nr:hypothetical protein [Candidatus Collierbacteria bacterium]